MIACLAVWIACAVGAFDPDRFYTATEVWKGSHAPRSMVYESLERGDLRAIRRGTRWLIPGSAAIAWLTSTAEQVTRSQISQVAERALNVPEALLTSNEGGRNGIA